MEIALAQNLEDLRNVSADTLEEDLSKLIFLVQSDEDISRESLDTVLGAFRAAIRHLCNENEKLKSQVDSLEKKLKELVVLRNGLVIGQIASIIEKTFIDYILQDCRIRNRKYLTIDQIGGAIRDKNSLESGGIFTTDDDLQRAKKRWKELNDKHHLTAGHYGAIRSFKSARNVKAHPDIKLEDAHKIILDCEDLDTDDRDIIIELLTVLQFMSVDKIGT